MSNNYRINRLLMDNNTEANSGLNPLISKRMGRVKGVSRRVKMYRFVKTQQYMCFLSVSCLLSTLFFLTIFYWNYDHLYHLYSNLNSSPGNPSRSNIKSIISTQTNSNGAKGLSIIDRNIEYNDFNYLQPDSLTYTNKTYADDLQVLFRFPEKRKMFGLLLIFHGCSRSAYEWFNTTERQRIIGGAIDLGYGCLAFQALDQEKRCWSTTSDIYMNEDIQRVFKALGYFYKEYPQLESLPRFTFGASSGGMFSSVFAVNHRYKIQGQILLISIIVPDILETYIKSKNYPPTAWIYMLRDMEFASQNRINLSMEIFAKEKIPHISFDIEPISLTSLTFHQRIPTIKSDTSHYIFYRLQQNHWLDSDNYLIYNPRRYKIWKEFLFTNINETVPTPMILENLHNHKEIVEDFLNTIYGQHEISFERSFEALTWLKNHSNSNNISNIQ